MACTVASMGDCDTLCPGRAWWQAQLQHVQRGAIVGDRVPELWDGLKRLQRLRAATNGVCLDDPPPTFHVTVAMLSGRTAPILGLHATDQFVQLVAKVSDELQIPIREMQVTFGEWISEDDQLHITLGALGLQRGSIVTCVRRAPRS